MTRRVSLSLPDDVVEAIDSVADEYSLTRSGIMRDVLGMWIDEENLEQAVEDAIPETTLKLAKKRAKEQELMDKQTLREKRASFEDRVRGYFRKRLEGDSAYHPEEQEPLAEGYKEDARIWHDDEIVIQRKCDLVDLFMDWYRAGYWAREHADAVETDINSSNVEGWFEVGEDIYRLRTHIDDVVDHIETIGDRKHGYVSEAVVESVAKRWSVCEGAVWLVLEHMVDREESLQDALNLGGLSGDGLKAGNLEALAEADYVRSVDDLPEGARLNQRSPTGETVEFVDAIEVDDE